LTEPPHPSGPTRALEQVLRDVMGASELASDGERPELPPHLIELIKDIGRATALQGPPHMIGRFEGLRMRGRGGFGLVFEVFDPELERNVALKICLTRGAKAAQAIINEAKLLAKLSHPNIVTVLEPGRYGDDVFFVMEFVDGSTVDDFALAEPLPTWEEIVDVYLGAGAGLAAAHKAGIVHGDFKPANILLDKDRNWPRVVDFGLAQIMIEHASETERERLRGRAGTKVFMAPEVLRGQPGDPLSDQWAFCVSLWQTLDRSLPFDGAMTDQLLHAIEHTQPWEMNPSVPEAVRAVLRVGLSPDPRQRYANMEVLLGALRKLREPAPVIVAAERARWRGFAIAMVLVGGTLLGILGTRGWQQVEQRELAPVEMPTRVPASPCAVDYVESSVDLEPVVVAVCVLIRDQRFADASDLWDREHGVRLKRNQQRPSTEGSAALLARDTLIVARTFVDQAEALELGGPGRGGAAAKYALVWVTRAAVELGPAHVGVKDVHDRAQKFARLDSTPSG
jgi:hypothetical protein